MPVPQVQRAARALARRCDDAFRPLGLRRGRYSLLVSLNRPEARRILTDTARDLLVRALPIWRAAHDALDRQLEAAGTGMRDRLLAMVTGDP